MATRSHAAGTRKESPSRSGAFASASSTVSDGRGSSSAQTFDRSSGCERRLDARQVELGDLADRLEDRVQLLGEPLELVLGELEPREPRDVQHLVS